MGLFHSASCQDVHLETFAPNISDCTMDFFCLNVYFLEKFKTIKKHICMTKSSLQINGEHVLSIEHVLNMYMY